MVVSPDTAISFFRINSLTIAVALDDCWSAYRFVRLRAVEVAVGCPSAGDWGLGPRGWGCGLGTGAGRRDLRPQQPGNQRLAGTQHLVDFFRLFAAGFGEVGAAAAGSANHRGEL